VTADGELDAAVLRHAAPGDIEIGHHLDARGDGKPRWRGGGTISYSTPSAFDADAEFVFKRLRSASRWRGL